MRTFGIDLATAPERTALCLIDWGKPPRVERLIPAGVTDELIVDLHDGADVIAIDAPFGWPIPFVDAVRSYDAGTPWPPERPEGLWFRRTDLLVQTALGGRSPLSVSSDRIARPAERAARLLTLLGSADGPAARDGSDGVIEVYPAGALRVWKLDVAGYKQPAARDARAAIRDALLRAIGLEIGAEHRAMLVATDHPLDALVAALVGRAFALGFTSRPEGDLIAVARREGWIHLPTIGLDRLNPA